MGVSLFTSRVILQTLGVEDYGIYGVVGGVVSMFTFINSSMASATQRYLTFELGRNDHDRLQLVFNNSMLIHIIIAVIVVVICETFGLWFLHHKMIIPVERMFAAEWCFHLSVLAAVISIVSVPYNALIIAHEKMGAFAYISILEVVIKLLIAYGVVFVAFDKLIFYAILQLLAQLTIRVIYGRYCRRHFSESKFQLQFEATSLKEMASFASFDLYGNLSVTARSQGVNILLNMFFGPVLNAASSIAAQVQGAIIGFANNVVMAVRPQVVKSYSLSEYNRTIYLIHKSSLICFILLLMLSMPVIVEAPYILHIWLGKVPEYTVAFCRLTLLFGLFSNLSLIVMMGIHATGKIKRPSFINGTLYLAVVPISYFAYKLGASPVVAFVFNVIAVIIGLLSNVWTLHLYLPNFSFFEYLKKVGIRIILFLVFYTIVLYFVSSLLTTSFLRLVVVCVVSIILSMIAVLTVLTKQERQTLLKRFSSNKNI